MFIYPGCIRSAVPDLFPTLITLLKYEASEQRSVRGYGRNVLTVQIICKIMSYSRTIFFSYEQVRAG